MILGTKKKIPTSVLHYFLDGVSQLGCAISFFFVNKKLMTDKRNLEIHFSDKYPSLKTGDVEEGSHCISCKVCEEICPTDAIEVILPKMVDFPPSLKFGEVPSQLLLNTDSCSKCGYCIKVCPVNALIEGNYRAKGIIDLNQSEFR